MKNKWLAAILNIMPGVGYLYVGVRTPFAVLLLLCIPASIVGYMTDSQWADALNNMPWAGWDWVMLAIGTLPFAVDAYLEAVQINGSHAPTKTRKS